MRVEPSVLQPDMQDGIVRHLEILGAILGEAGTVGNMTTDAVLAALAIEYRCELHSNDTDFARFSGFRWINPLR
jgi:predicted nucleic acid-binding protein